ncbi:MAG: FAD-dependent monooxygenase [Acidimicrobiaceae bacterium]|nr:FAD-dependent monooxygenase [Acidimicrobiaceae bacterium]
MAATSKRLEVLVVGGGIGGLCLAQGLVKAGVGVRVFERDVSSEARLDRYRLHISPAGSRALRSCLPDRSWRRLLVGAGAQGGGFGFLTEQLATLVVVEDSVMYPASADPAEQAYPVDRAFLRDVLLDGLGDAVSFGRVFVGYESDGERIRACFADGRTEEGNVLVGADGVRSVVRHQFLPGVEPKSTGAAGIGWTVPLEQVAAGRLRRLAEGMNMVMAAAPFFLFTSVYRHDYSISDGDYLLCAFVTRQDTCPPALAGLEGPALRGLVAKQMTNGGWHRALIKLVCEADPATFGAFPFEAIPSASEWAPSRITLLGDAIHPMPPAGGNGANMALRDAHLLCRQLAQADGGQLRLVDAIAAYETDMRDYGFAAVRGALRNQSQGLTANGLAQAGMRGWFRLSALVPAVRRVGFGHAWADDARPRPWETVSPAAAATADRAQV